MIRPVREVYSSEITEETASDLDSIVIITPPLRAYINDPYDNSSTNIRKEPGGEIIQTLDCNENRIIEIHAKCGRWFKIGSIDDVDTIITFPNNTGWVHGSVIELGTRNYGGQALKLRAEANHSSDLVTQIIGESAVKLIDIKGKWIKVEYFKNKIRFEGWIESEWLCGNPHTNCC